MRTVFALFCLALICVSVVASNVNVEVNVGSRRNHQRNRSNPQSIESDDDVMPFVHAGTPDANRRCTAAGGVCGTSCNDGSFTSGLCSGDSNVRCCIKTPTPTGNGIDRILSIASTSRCRNYQWRDRGRMPVGYAKGFAMTWAKAVCNSDRNDVAFAAAAKTTGNKDTLNWYDSVFRAAGMSNSASGLDTARHTYTLTMGLGMRESSGKHCVGRDMSMGFSTASSAEAGLIQTSFGASNSARSILPGMYQKYKSAPTKGCFLTYFKEGVSCGQSDWKNWGTGDGMMWQKLTKDCPAFAVEYGAVIVRSNGGAKGEFGPLRKRNVELRPECDQMLKQVQDYVQATPDVCTAINAM
jgi:hypothetical protein